MPRFPKQDETTQASIAPLIEQVKKIMGFVPNSLLAMGLRPEMASTFMQLATTIMAPQEGGIDRCLKQLIALVASSAAGCRYCMAHTAHAAQHVGVDVEKIENVWAYETDDRFTAAERAALQVARGAAMVPNEVTDKDYAELKRYYSPVDIVDIMGVIALFGFLNRWNDTLATELEPSPLKFASEHLAESGWNPGKHTN